MDLPDALHPVTNGRIFVRSAESLTQGRRVAGGMILLGVVEVPRSADLERMHTARLNERFWLDVHAARQPRTHQPGNVREMDASGLLLDLQWARSGLADSFEVFLRATMLPDPDPGRRWAYVVAALDKRLATLPVDGLYELGAGATVPRLVSTDIFAGEPPAQILRTPIWGPDGRYGMSTSMEPEFFPTWLAEERASPRMQRERLFQLFVKRVDEKHPKSSVYTADEHRAREAVCAQVLHEISMLSPEAIETQLQAYAAPDAACARPSADEAAPARPH